jgi:alpha-beta hydrolase superfamily lysophospholipase
MGAVTALLYSQQDPSVAGMVLDSPFSRLVDLMLELASDQQLRIPKPLLKASNYLADRCWAV